MPQEVLFKTWGLHGHDFGSAAVPGTGEGGMDMGVRSREGGTGLQGGGPSRQPCRGATPSPRYIGVLSV